MQFYTDSNRIDACMRFDHVQNEPFTIASSTHANTHTQTQTHLFHYYKTHQILETRSLETLRVNSVIALYLFV